MSDDQHIILENVSTNNLKNIDVRFPVGVLSVVTGVSGSGKSSLVFDTLYAESYRRYVESLSSFARQYLKSLPKPEIGRVDNLPSAIAIKQARGFSSNRSTVGTLTELIDYLRMLYSQASQTYCYGCGALVEKETAESIACKILVQCRNQTVMPVASLDHFGSIKAKDLKEQLLAQGFSRGWLDGKIIKLEKIPAKDLKKSKLIIDRIIVKKDSEPRLANSIKSALKIGKRTVQIKIADVDDLAFSSDYTCASCNIEYIEPCPSLFSFNSPQGACSTCQGYGNEQVIDWGKVVPDMESSLKEKGIAPLSFGNHSRFYRKILNTAVKLNLDPAKKFKDYTAEDWDILRYGDHEKNQSISGYFAWVDTKKYKQHYRMHAARYKKYVTCKECHGQRLNKKALSCLIDEKSISDVSSMSVEELLNWINGYFISKKETVKDSDKAYGLKDILDEIKLTLNYLMRVGLSYLSIDRASMTLSGGELQRISMARSLSSSLTDTLFCLDEPTSGLHVRDSEKLLEVLYDLRDQGNSVVVVEHEDSVIQKADYLCEVGPEAGAKGGYIVYQGEPQKNKIIQKTIKNNGIDKFNRFITITGVSTHNLKNINASFPVGKMTVVCGVSGSGKTSLVQHSLFPELAGVLGQEIKKDLSDKRVKKIGPLKEIKNHHEVMMVSQAPLGRSSRSNIATYLGIFDKIRDLFAAQPLSVKLGLKKGAFSFNVSGGRCEHCKGLGYVLEDMSFLGEMAVICPVCEGRCFNDEVLSVEYNEKNLLGILKLTVDEGRSFFFDIPKITKILDDVIRMGLGYVTLGQSTSSFSGGEAQRLKLLSLMKKTKMTKPSILIFDEPTTGLADSDVKNLLMQFDELKEQGHTLIVIEHHLDIMRNADWLIEVGPEMANLGGEIVYEGPVSGIKKVKESVTAPYI